MEDMKFYGYAPRGEIVTCIVGATGESFVSQVREDRTFSIRIPLAAIEYQNESLVEPPPTFVLNITDAHNRQYVSHALNPIDQSYVVRRRKTELARTRLLNALAPSFALPDLEGRIVSLDSLRGHPTLINVWATWCVPCIEEMPLLQEAYINYEATDLNILTVNYGESIDTIIRFLQQTNYTFPVLIDTSNVMRDVFGVHNLPRTMLIDHEGIVRFFRNGQMDSDLFATALSGIVK